MAVFWWWISVCEKPEVWNWKNNYIASWSQYLGEHFSIQLSLRLASSCSKRNRDIQLVAAPLVRDCVCLNLDASDIAGLPAATTGQMGRVNSTYRAVSSSNELLETMAPLQARKAKVHSGFTSLLAGQKCLRPLTELMISRHRNIAQIWYALIPRQNPWVFRG